MMKNLRLLLSILFVASLLLSSCQAPSPSPTLVQPTFTPSPSPSATPVPPRTEWAMFRGDLAHSGVYSNVGGYGEWFYQADGQMGSSPVLAGGTLFFGSMNGTLYALDPQSRQVKWKHTIDGGMFSTPCVANGVLYASGLQSGLYALDMQTGQEQWKFQAGNAIVSSPAVDGNTVYFGSEDHFLYAVDAQSGKQKWKVETQGPVTSSPIVAGDAILVGSLDNFIYALDSTSGKIRWENVTEGQVISSPAVWEDTVFVGSMSATGSFYALDLKTGKIRWKKGLEPIGSSPAIVDRTLYVGGVNGNVYALAAQDGTVLWKFQTKSLIISSPAVTAQTVYIASTDGNLYAIDRTSGNQQWSFHTNGEIWSSPLVAGSTIFFTSPDQYLYAVSSQGPKLALAPTPTSYPIQPTPTMLPKPSVSVKTGSSGLPWWNDRVFYEVFVRSFSDSNGDGIGDLQGLINKLDYLQSLGVNGLWLMPIAESPSIHGYDAIDYRKVEPAYGTNDDFKKLITEAHRRGIVVIVDMVLNHTSNLNPWFLSAANPGSPYENWYIWSPTNPGYKSPWNTQVWDQMQPSLSPMRAYNTLNDFYYALFSPTQPDLNYRNGAVTLEMYDILRFWLQDMQVDGFRLDAVRHLIEEGSVQANTPETHAWLQGFYRYVHTVSPQALTVGEIWDKTDQIVPYVGDQVDIAFEFNIPEAMLNSIDSGDRQPLDNTWQKVLLSYADGQYATFLSNHDQTRIMTALQNNPDKARLAAILLLSMPGVPFIYYGEEIGMTGALPDINVRTPMQWDGATNAGFTSGKPWYPVNPDYFKVNVASEAADRGSLFTLYQNLIQQRLKRPALLGGNTVFVESNLPQVYSMLRSTPTESVLLVANLSDKPVYSYSLSLHNGPLKAGQRASLILSSTTPGGKLLGTPYINSAGGFYPYMPLASLPPYSAYLILLK